MRWYKPVSQALDRRAGELESDDEDCGAGPGLHSRA